MTETAEARYEFRSWAESLAEVEGRLRTLAEAGPVRESEELYIASAASETANVKIRHGLLDIKLLLERHRGLERWMPRAKLSFPLSPDDIAGTLMPAFGLEAPALAQRAYDLETLLEELVRPRAELAAVEVSKRRHGFTLGGCKAELAEVTLDGGALQSAAVEATDPEAVLRALETLGLAEAENVSYPLAIKRAIGMAPP